MDNLSTSFNQWIREHGAQPGGTVKLDAVVIGSGYGGSVAALRLAEMGRQVTLLERGSEFKPGEFPAGMSELPKFVRAPSADGQQVTGRANGLFEFRAGPGVVSLVGNGLGGGSLINAGVALKPDPEVFAQEPWPAAIRLPAGVSGEPAGILPGMDEWLEHAATVLDARDWPYGTHPKTRAFRRMARHMRFPSDKACTPGISAVPVTIDSQKCIDCGNCATGCNVAGAKLTLRDTYLRSAHAAKATLVSGATVWTIAPVRAAGADDGDAPARAWRLRVVDTTAVSRWPGWEHAAREEGLDIEAGLVVLSAGTFGSTELLQRSRDRCGERWWISPALGSRFSGNGDSLNFIVDELESVGAIGTGSTGVPEPTEQRPGVGPTITREINLRQAGNIAPIPLRNRLTIQDAAVPWAIARVFQEMVATGLTTSRLDNWRTGAPRTGWKRYYKQVDALSKGQDPLAASEELAGMSHVVLTMGHDGSPGRIVWVPGRDASVPYWETPEDLETYRVQEEVFRDTATSMSAEWVPNPAWRLLPEGASQTMSGPAPAPAITTVHPLGGCIMGDEPGLSVVDDRGRLWRSDCPVSENGQDTESREDWQRHDNFLVLDGSVIPTSLGVNPLLTITALAERSMAALKMKATGMAPVLSGARSGNGERRAGDGSGDAPCRPPGGDKWEVTLRERLVGMDLPVHGVLHQAFGSSRAHGELDLSLVVHDWLKMWELARHPIDGDTGEVTGTLRLQVGEHWTSAKVATYRVAKTERCELLAVPGYGLPQCPSLRRWLRGLARITGWPRTFITYLILRPDIIYAWRNPKPGERESALETVSRRFVPGLRQFGHFTEKREMTYELELKLHRGRRSDHPDAEVVDFDEHWTRVWYDNVDHPERLPESIWLRGRKRVEYAATWPELRRYFGHWLRRALVRLWRRVTCSRRAGEPAMLPRLRESFFDQSSHLDVTLFAGAWQCELLEGRFMMDFPHLLQYPPLRLGPDGLPPREVAKRAAGDLTTGLAVLGAYPGVFSRFLVKTRLADFRLPDYSQIPLPDAATPEQLALLPDPARYLPPGEQAPGVKRYVLRVPRGQSSGDGIGVNADREFELVLWRYARPAPKPGAEGARDGDTDDYGLPGVAEGTWYGKRVDRLKSALLVHAYAQSGYSFTLNTLPDNLAGRLYREGFEVWVLEHRLSTRLPIHEEPVTLDEVARHDLPRAVSFILDTLTGEFRGKKDLENPQLHAFAQCMGSAALAMSLLQGRLHHPGVLSDDADEWAPHCPKLASIVFSQTHMMCIGQPGTQARTWIPSFIRDAVGRATIPLGVRGPVHSLLEASLDRIFAALPVPEEERCPSTPGTGEDDCATCRRVRFIEAPLFRHRNLNAATHRQLPLHFGQASVPTFAQAARCVETERLVDEDGLSVYVTDANAARYCALPMAFLHGKENELFHPESATRTAEFIARLHPDWAQLAAGALPEPETRTGLDGAAWFVRGHGHYDVLIGTQAPLLVYPGIARFFETVQQREAQGDTARARPPLHAVPHLPRVGPVLGPPRYDRTRDRISFQVSFMLDDRFSEGRGDGSGAPGDRAWAFVRVPVKGAGPPRYRTFMLDIAQRPASARRPDSPSLYRDPGDEATAYRFAVGELELDPGEWDDGAPLDMVAFSVHQTLAAVPGEHAVEPDPGFGDGSAGETPSEQWLDKLQRKLLANMLNLAGYRLPIRSTVSRVRLEAEHNSLMWARMPPATRAAFIARPGEPAPDSVTFLAGTCRYPGFPFDRHRAEHAVQRVLPMLLDENAEHHPAFGLFVGDQIYADATAGFVDPLSPTERFVERHRRAFSRSPEFDRPALGDLLANLPAVMTPDDHEYIDNYPSGPPLVKARTAAKVESVNHVAFAAAADAWRYFQSFGGRGGVAQQGWENFEVGPLRVLVLDTRTYREKTTHRIFSDAQRDRIQAWLGDGAAQDHLNLIVTGSVVLPGLDTAADPANPGEPDTFQWSRDDRDFLLAHLARACAGKTGDHFRFALLSGDYHVSLVTRLELEGLGVRGVSIVAPPVYAPMPYINAPPQSVDFSRVDFNLAGVAAGSWSVAPVMPDYLPPLAGAPGPGGPGPAQPTGPEAVMTGSAIAAIGVSRTGDPRRPYRLSWRASLVDHAQGTAAREATLCESI